MTLIRKETRTFEENKYEYYLYVAKSHELSSFRLPLYSIKVRLTLQNGNVSEHLTKDLFSDFSHATEFYEMLIDKLVTPINLPYVIEDSLYSI